MVGKITRPGWFWTGVALLVVGLEWQIVWAAGTCSLPLKAPLTDIYIGMVVALPFIPSGAGCFWWGLVRSHLSRPIWLMSGRALLYAGLGLPSIILLLLGFDGRALDMRFVISILVGSGLPFIALSVFCFIKGRGESRAASLKKPAIPIESSKTGRPILFWIGLLFFMWGSVFGWVMFMGLMASGGRYLPDPAFAFGTAIVNIALGIVLLWLSRRKLRHGWFWPGASMSAWGLGSIPQWVNIWSNEAVFPKDTSILGSLAIRIGVFSVPWIIGGAFCLWRGWPRAEVKHRQGERFSFIFTSIAICLVWSLSLVFSATAQKDILSFSDNFDDGNASGWNLDSGWRVIQENGNYVLEGQGQDLQSVAPKVTSAENYVLAADFELISGGFEFSVRFRGFYSRYIVWLQGWVLELT